MLQYSLTQVSLVLRVIEAWLKLLVYSCGGVLGKRLSEYVLWLDVRYEPLITGNVLSLDVLGWSSNPILSLLRRISELNTVILKVLWSLLRIKSSLGMLYGSASCHQSSLGVLWVLSWLINNDAVGLASGARENFHFLGNVAGVPGEILFLVIDLSCHFLNQDCYNCFS